MIQDIKKVKLEIVKKLEPFKLDKIISLKMEDFPLYYIYSERRNNYE